MQFAKENPCGVNLPEAIKVGDEEEISEQAVASTLRRALRFYSNLQAEDGHWPGDYGGPMFLLPGLVRIFTKSLYWILLNYCLILSIHSLTRSSIYIALYQLIKTLNKNLFYQLIKPLIRICCMRTCVLMITL